MKWWILGAMALVETSCASTYVGHTFHLKGETDQASELTLDEGGKFELCWHGCSQGSFNVVKIDGERDRLELTGGGVGRKFKNILRLSRSHNFSDIDPSSIGYSNEDYIDLDIFKSIGGNKIYIYTEPDIYFE